LSGSGKSSMAGICSMMSSNLTLQRNASPASRLRARELVR
jgi:hypothetical protein